MRLAAILSALAVTLLAGEARAQAFVAPLGPGGIALGSRPYYGVYGNNYSGYGRYSNYQPLTYPQPLPALWYTPGSGYSTAASTGLPWSPYGAAAPVPVPQRLEGYDANGQNGALARYSRFRGRDYGTRQYYARGYPGGRPPSTMVATTPKPTSEPASTTGGSTQPAAAKESLPASANPPSK